MTRMTMLNLQNVTNLHVLYIICLLIQLFSLKMEIVKTYYSQFKSISCDKSPLNQVEHDLLK